MAGPKKNNVRYGESGKVALCSSSFRCLHCDMVFKTLQGQKMHIEERHCDVLYKCSICPVAFKTTDSCEVHLNKKHSSRKVSPQ